MLRADRSLRHHFYRAWLWHKFGRLRFDSGLGDCGWALHGLVRAMKPEVCVEMGTARGYSTCLIALALKSNLRGRLWAIDPHRTNEWTDHAVQSTLEPLRRHLRSLRVDHLVEIVVAPTAEAAPALPPRIDFAFIDGDHSYAGVKLDWETVRPRMTDFGVVVFHDSLWDRHADDPKYRNERRENTGVPQFLEELRRQGYPMITLDRDWGLTLVQATPGGQPFVKS